MDAIKIPVICLLAALAAVFLGQYRKEYAVLTSLAAGTVILCLLLGKIAPLFGRIYQLTEISSVSEYYGIALKALGISYITAFAANTCRDAGQSALAAKAELAGRCAVMLLALPLLQAVLELALKFAKL